MFEYLSENTLEINVSITYSSKMEMDEIQVSLDNHEMILKERMIVVGLGCRRGKECINIYNGLKSSIDELGIDISRINMLS